MGYVGNQQGEGFSQVPAKQDLTGATGTSLTLSHAVASAEGIDLFINNVRQEPTTAYSVGGDGVTVTLTGSVVATDDIYVVYNSLALQATVPPDASVSTAKIIDGSVTATKLAAGVQGVAGISSSSTSGTALSIDANNIVTTPARPAFFAHSPTNASRSSDAVLVFASETFDRTNNYNNTTGEFTCPVDGIYLFSWHCLHTYNGAYGITKLQLNGSNYANAQTYSGVANGGSSTASATLYCQANDVVRVFNMGTTYSSVTNDNYAFFSGHLVG